VDLVIADAEPADAGEIMTVQRAAFLIEGELNGSFTLPPMTETLDEIRAAIGADDTVVLVARLGHRIVGSIRGVVAGGIGDGGTGDGGTGDGGTGQVGRLAVAPDLHGQGIGRRLMAAIEAALAGRVTRFELFTGGTSEGNLRLYRSLGYVDIGWRPAAAAPGLAYLEKRV
jgi:ribosomal protein S18 acetylase RimI-like enzyme